MAVSYAWGCRVDQRPQPSIAYLPKKGFRCGRGKEGLWSNWMLSNHASIWRGLWWEWCAVRRAFRAYTKGPLTTGKSLLNMPPFIPMENGALPDCPPLITGQDQPVWTSPLHLWVMQGNSAHFPWQHLATKAMVDPHRRDPSDPEHRFPPPPHLSLILPRLPNPQARGERKPRCSMLFGGHEVRVNLPSSKWKREEKCNFTYVG